MRIAIMGTRGIPAHYGGFETFAEQLGRRLVQRGNDVWVYCRTNNISYEGQVYEGVNLVMLPTISTKYLDTPVHTLLSVLHGMGKRYDVVLMCNAANAVYCWMPRVAGSKVALNVDGIERHRAKWGPVGKAWCWLSERLAILTPNRIVADAWVIDEYYRQTHNAEPVMIAYGSELAPVSGTETLKRLGIQTGRYALYVGRLEPENNAHLVVRAYRSVDTEIPLVVAGDAPYARRYKSELQTLARADERVMLIGGVYGSGYRELMGNAGCYIQATEVGGTHPTLVEAMGAGRMIIANDTPENVEVLGDAGMFYKRNDPVDLGRSIQWLIDHPEELDSFRRKARERARKHYSWNSVTDQYEELFERLVEPDRDSVG